MLLEFASLSAGNKCGHDKHSPRNFTRPANKSRPLIIEEAISALDNFYTSPLLYLQRLIKVIPASSPFDSAKERFKRSERREAIKVVAQAILYYLDIESLTLGFKKSEGGWWTPTLQKISDLAGINLQRTKRALYDLANAGYIKVTRQRLRKGQGTYQSKPSIRQIYAGFFVDLGIRNKRLKQAQERRQKLEIERSKQEIQEAIQNGTSPFKSLIQTINQTFTKKSSYAKKENYSKPEILSDSAEAQKKRLLIEKASYLHELDPSLSISDHYKNLLKSNSS